MRAFFNTFKRELHWFGQHRALPLITVVFPLVLCLIYSIMFSESVIRQLPVVVCDEDVTTTSRQVVNMIRSKSALHVIMQTHRVEEARKMMAQKHAAAVVYIPKNFEADILAVNGSSAKVMIDGSYISRANMLYKDLMVVFQALNIGVETKMLSSQGIPTAMAYQIAYPIVLDQHVLFNPYTNYSYFLLPGLFPLLLVVASLFAAITSVGGELRYGTAKEWLEVANGSIWIALIGKLLVYLIIFILESTFFNMIIFKILGIGVNFTEAVLVGLGSILMLISYMTIGVTFVAITLSLRFALSFGTLYGVAAFSFSGLAFPSVAMPIAIQIIGHIFPYYFYMELFIEQGMRNNPDYTTALLDIVMFLIFIVVAALPIPLLKKHCTNPKSYGRL